MSLPREFKVSAVTHIMLGVADLAASVDFYCDRLGLTLAFQSPGIAFVSGRQITLVLSEQMAAVCDQLVGATEVVFGVDDVEHAHAELFKKGVVFTHAPREVTPGQWAANFTDPDGHRLSVFGPETQSREPVGRDPG